MQTQFFMLNVGLDFTSLTFTAMALKVMHAEIKSGPQGLLQFQSSQVSVHNHTPGDRTYWTFLSHDVRTIQKMAILQFPRTRI